MSYKFDLKPSPVDNRDHHYICRSAVPDQIIDLRQWDSDVEDQGNLGSCTGNAITNAFENQVLRLKPQDFVELSRLFVYYNSRFLEGSADSDTGVMFLRNAMRSLSKFGVCDENLWPYDVSKFSIKPNDLCYTNAKTRLITEYQALSTISEMIDALNNRLPIVIGMLIFEGFMNVNDDSSIVQLPNLNEYEVGGHAVCVVGYDLSQRLFLIKNSFGEHWGISGYCWISFEYINYYCFDRWIFTI